MALRRGAWWLAPIAVLTCGDGTDPEERRLRTHR